MLFSHQDCPHAFMTISHAFKVILQILFKLNEKNHRWNVGDALRNKKMVKMDFEMSHH